MAEFSTCLQTRQEERYVILLEIFMAVALAIPPLILKNRPVRLIGRIRFNGFKHGLTRYLNRRESSFKLSFNKKSCFNKSLFWQALF